MKRKENPYWRLEIYKRRSLLVNTVLLYMIREIAAKTDKTTKDLLEEAFNDLVNKYSDVLEEPDTTNNKTE